MVSRRLKWAAVLAAFVPLVVSVVDLYKGRGVSEAKSAQMEDQTVTAVDELWDRVDDLESRLTQLEAPRGKKVRKKAPRMKFERQFIQQSEQP